MVWYFPCTLYSSYSNKKSILCPPISFYTLPYNTWYLSAFFYPYQAHAFCLRAHPVGYTSFITHNDTNSIWHILNQVQIRLGFLFHLLTCILKSAGLIYKLASSFFPTLSSSCTVHRPPSSQMQRCKQLSAPVEFSHILNKNVKPILMFQLENRLFHQLIGWTSVYTVSVP